MAARKTITLVFLIFFAFSVENLFATEEFAAATGKDCGICHLDPAGGGELTSTGKGYALSLGHVEDGLSVSSESTVSHLFQLLVGYLHILFGFFWFGTILYVHLILKPGYASGGLPRGEVKLGLISMVVMGISGAILFAYRVPDPSILVTSRFGILLLVKIILYLIMVCSALFAVFVLGPRLRRKGLAPAPSNAGGDWSLEQLSEFDGKEGRNAYFAYQGTIYDASPSRLWKNGSHMGRHQAGHDLTDALGQAPHGDDKIQAMEKTGKLLGDGPHVLTPPQKLFYTMAYLNLCIVLMILLVLACWKWW